MISEKMRGYVENSSAIRAMFEEGKKMADQFGAENVYDFSLGNPNVPAPAEVKNAIEEIFKVTVVNVNTVNVHGKMKRMGRTQGMTASWKKAVVTLREGDSIEVFEGL